MVDMVETHGMQSDVMVMSLSQEGIRKLKQLRPSWKTGLLTAVAMGRLARVPADFLAVQGSLGTRSFVKAARGQGKQVMVWTINDAVSMSMMLNRGVDGIITDKPALRGKCWRNGRNWTMSSARCSSWPKCWVSFPRSSASSGYHPTRRSLHRDCGQSPLSGSQPGANARSCGEHPGALTFVRTSSVVQPRSRTHGIGFA